MKFVIEHPQHSLETTAIVSTSLDMYDEVMVSCMTATLFKVTIFEKALWRVYRLEHPELEPGECTWHSVRGSTFGVKTIVPIDIPPGRPCFSFTWVELFKLWSIPLGEEQVVEFPCALYDQRGNLLASGKVIEYKQNHEDGTVILSCTSRIADILNKEITYEKVYTYSRQMNAGGYAENIANTRSIIKAWLDYIWGRCFAGTGITYEFTDWDTTWGPIANFIANRPNGYSSGPTYYFKFDQNTSSTAGEMLKRLALSACCKALFNSETKIFTFKPFAYYKNPIPITGHIINEEYNTRAAKETELLFVQFGIKSGQNTEWYSLNANFTTRRLPNTYSYYSYELWGYAPDYNNIIYSGQTVFLNNERYYIQDINYEPETLDTIKTFKAQAVRWA